MIKCSISIRNPFAKDIVNKTYNFYKIISVTKYKTFEVQLCKLANYYWFLIALDLNFRGTDHAGPQFDLFLFGWELTLKLYDNRHWDYLTGTWTKDYLND